MFTKYFSRWIFAGVIIIITICAFNALAQEIPVRIHGEKMKYFLDYEMKLGSKLFQGQGDIIIGGGMAMPVTYRRAEKGIPDLLVTYIFSIKDSLIDRIDYEWDMINFEPSQKTQSLVVQKAFIKKYLSLVEQLNIKVGKSEQKGDLSDLSKIDVRGGLTRGDKWKPNDTTYINMYSVFSNYQEAVGNMTRIPTNRIRLSISKTKKPAPELSDEAIMAAMKSYEQFIIKLRAGDMEGAKTLLSMQIRNQLSESVFNNLKVAIKAGDFEIYSQNLESIAGSNYLVIQYGYAGVSAKSKEGVKVVFDKEHFIIGIQPVVWKAMQ